jgi:thiopeptide-type bacteriocin biosynthesis protein
LLRDLAIPSKAGHETPWTERDAILLGQLGDALASGRYEIRLEAADIDRLSVKEPGPLPNAFSVFAAIAATDAGAIARGDFQVRLDGVDGPSGARLLGRFCYADPALSTCVEEHLRAEERYEPDALYAEIVHLPEGRLGNILFRPLLRPFEIPYLGQSGVARDQQIPISDLMVSVRGEDVTLRSRSLNRRIVPRLTSAHNFGWKSVGVYRFLCALQSQGLARGLAWDWGPLDAAPFLPRVISGRLVLSRARWRLAKPEIDRLGKCAGRPLFEEIQRLRAERRLPRWVVLADGDNTLPVDLDNILSLESFAHAVKERDGAVLKELFPDPDHLCATGPDGHFVHEVVIPFVRDVQPIRDGAGRTDPHRTTFKPPLESPSSTVCRSFPPGSEWLYVKLYAGTATADEVLREVVAPVVRAAIATGSADRWFFVRYYDPESHLRWRLHGDPCTLQQTVWPALQDAVRPFLAERRIWKVVLDTYEREIERYGGPDGIALAEQVFHIDSDAVLEIVEMLDRGDAGLDERWRLALVGMERLLTDFGFDLESKLSILTPVRTVFAKEFHADRALARQLGDRFRTERASLRDLLDNIRIADVHPLAPGLDIFVQRSDRLGTVIDELKVREASGRLTSSCRDIVPSLLHMHANRLLRSAPREQEMVLYDFLARHHESRAAIQRRQAKLQPV